MKAYDWDNTEESTGGNQYRHTEGGFVIEITDATDREEYKSIWLDYGIAEGDQKGIYQSANRIFRGYETRDGKPSPQFKSMLVAFEKSNPAFDIKKWQAAGCSEKRFIGMYVGAVFGKELYTYNGKDYERPYLWYMCAADDIRSGKYKPAPVRDNREKPATTDEAPTAYDDADVPF